MPNFDDLLSRELERAARPAVPDRGYVVDEVRRRRARRGVVRRVQAGALTVAVLAATTTGFVALSRIFGEDPAPGPATQLSANGQIVFSRELRDGSAHLFAVQADGSGERQISPVGAATYREPAISPDGRTIAVVHRIPSFEGGFPEAGPAVIATLPLTGGEPTWLMSEPGIVGSPAWSPTGSEIAFFGNADGALGIFVMNADGSDPRRIAGSASLDVGDPAWSPDGSRIALFGWNDDSGGAEDIFSVFVDGSDLRRLTNTPGIRELSPAWSPDGRSIAFVRHDGRSASIELISTSGEALGQVFAFEGAQITDLTWSPDGRWLLFASTVGVNDFDADNDLDLWRIRLDGSGAAQITLHGARGGTWQPIPDGTVLPTPEPEPAGRDIGLGFPVCNVSRTKGDFNADGQIDTAFVATKLSDTGPCAPSDAFNVVAIDVDADGLADVSYGPLESDCPNECAAFDATDFDGNGSDELVVTSTFSIVDFYLFSLRPNDAGDPQVEPILAAEPGHKPAGIPGGEPLRIDAGGDEGYSSRIWCEGYPASPVIVWAWSDAIVESQQPKEVHVTRLQLRADGLFHVIGTNDYTVPPDQPASFEDQTGPACGVNWHPSP